MRELDAAEGYKTDLVSLEGIFSGECPSTAGTLKRLGPAV